MKKFVKRSISLALSIVMIISLLMVGASAANVESSYTDTAGSPYAVAIEALAKAGILLGTGNGQYSPNSVVSRAAAVTVLGRIAGVKETYSNSFTDVPAGAWYANYVGWAVENGIVTDDGSGSFRPDAPVTGAEMSAMLAGCAELTGTAYAASNQSEEALTRSELADMAYRFFVNKGKGEMDDGYTTFQADYSYSSVVTWCVNENAEIFYGEKDAMIFGKMYYPANFDPAKTYPTVIISHGLGNSGILLDLPNFPWVSELTASGYVVYGFDFCGGSPAGGFISSRSDGEWHDMSLLTEVDDLHCVIDFVKELDYVNNDQLFLIGQSQGGFVTAITAAQREADGKADIAGTILLWPAFSMLDGANERFPTEKDLPTEPVPGYAGQPDVGARYIRDIFGLKLEDLIAGYSGKLLIIHGMADRNVPYTASVEAMDKFYADIPDAELVLVAGAGHTFVGMGGSPAAVSIAVSSVNHSLAMWIESNAQ